MQLWQEALGIFESVMKQVPETETLYGLMESQDYVYPIDGWLQDYEMELGNAGKYGKRITFCQKILEIFDWQDEDDSCFRCGIGESLYREGKVGKAYEAIRKVTWGVSCYADNAILFMRARQLTDSDCKREKNIPMIPVHVEAAKSIRNAVENKQ